METTLLHNEQICKRQEKKRTPYRRRRETPYPIHKNPWFTVEFGHDKNPKDTSPPERTLSYHVTERLSIPFSVFAVFCSLKLM
ncbi:hypothetical protein XELAEV_18008306mg [Xenopus laevis]|uniref:Uncharacterized protein n=1 Tax=Xenopus laevis TaxID=8355 RepID=A0A974I5Z5_XENLA|nr:hypothetical protein XELAEV_18008306mg [Xenopus laevis]